MLQEVMLEIAVQVHDGTFHLYEHKAFLYGMPQRGMLVDGYGLPPDQNGMGADSIVIAVKFCERELSPMWDRDGSGSRRPSLRVSLVPHRAPAHTREEIPGQVLQGGWRHVKQLMNVVDLGQADYTGTEEN